MKLDADFKKSIDRDGKLNEKKLFETQVLCIVLK